MTLRTFGTNEVLTATNLMTYVQKQDGKPLCVLAKSATQTLTTAVVTAVTWDVESFDTDGAHSTVTNSSRFTAVTAGYYRLDAGVEWQGNTTGLRDLAFRVNAVATDYLAAHVAGLAANWTQNVGGILPVRLVAGDYIELYATQSSGGNLTVGPGTAARTFLTIEYLGN